MRIVLGLWSTSLALLAGVAGAQTDLMFVTSAKGTGNLSSWPQAEGMHGIAAGNHICQKLAETAGLANFATFQAWLSDGSTDAACNIKARSGHPPTCGSFTINNPGPWARKDGAPFARNVATLTAGAVMNAPLLDENGNESPSLDGVWTGTDGDGTVSNFGNVCADAGGVGWNNADGAVDGDSGYVPYGPVKWTNTNGSSCNQLHHLYCFQHSVFGGPPFEPFESPGALVFRTSTTYTGDLGTAFEADGKESLAAGDAICQARARAGNLPDPGSFRAWLSVVAVDARDHIGYDGPFKRPDGIQIASSMVDLTDGELASAPDQTELLAYGDAFTRTGTDENGVFDDRNCFDFTQSDSSVHGVVGLSNDFQHWSFDFATFCSTPLPIYCFSVQPILFWTGFEEGGGFWRWSGTGG